MNSKVDTLSKSVEENQERTRANEGRIGEVDQKAGGRRAARRRGRPAARRSRGQRGRQPSTRAPTPSRRRRSGSSTK